MLRISNLGRRRQLEALASTLAGSWLWVMRGDRPDSVDGQINEGDVLARVFLGQQGVAIEDDPITGRPQVVVAGVNALVEGQGRASWFVVRLSPPDSVPIMDGTIEINKGDLPLTRVDLLPGDRFIVDRLVMWMPS